jgi:hypothetical protein
LDPDEVARLELEPGETLTRVRAHLQEAAKAEGLNLGLSQQGDALFFWRTPLPTEELSRPPRVTNDRRADALAVRLHNYYEYLSQCYAAAIEARHWRSARQLHKLLHKRTPDTHARLPDLPAALPEIIGALQSSSSVDLTALLDVLVSIGFLENDGEERDKSPVTPQVPSDQVSTRRPKFLLATPFSGAFSSIRKLIADALRDVGIEPILIDELGSSSLPVTAFVQQAIERADVVIADITDANPNVMYEVGFAHALRKPMLLIVQDGGQRIPTNLFQGYIYLVYDPSKPDTVRGLIQRWANDYAQSISRSQVTELASA